MALEGLETLVHFGLTTNQAKIYLTMVQSNADTIKKISKLSKIPLESIYRTMPRLEEKMIVEKIFATPSKYRAVPLSYAIALLKTRDEQERRQLYKEADALSKKFCKVELTSKVETDPETILISGFKAYAIKLHEALGNATDSFQGITHSKGFRAGMYNEGRFEGLVKRGIECRHMVYDSNIVNKLGDDHLLENPLWLRKEIPPIPTHLILLDKKKLFLSLTPTEMGKDYKGLATTNLSLLSLANGYFDLLWKNSGMLPKNLVN